jgi:hypothetical protein
MPDLPGFFAAASRLLRDGGKVFVLEMHPLLDGVERRETAIKQVKFRASYFAPKPHIELKGLDYYGNKPYESSPAYWFHHRLSEILNACGSAGFTLQRIEEYPIDLSGGAFRRLQHPKTSLPLSYSLLAAKT